MPPIEFNPLNGHIYVYQHNTIFPQICPIISDSWTEVDLPLNEMNKLVEMLFTYRFNVFGKLPVVFFILSEFTFTAADWYADICNAGMCFNDDVACLRSCDQICREHSGRGFCNYDPFIRIHICWCGYDQSETTTIRTTPLPVPILANNRATLTESEDCGSSQCFDNRDTCDSYCPIRCHPQLYSCDLRWHGRYKCLCIHQVVVQSLKS